MIKRVLTRIQCMRYKIKYENDLFIHPLSVINARKGNCLLGREARLSAMTRIDCSANGVVKLGMHSILNTGSRIEADKSVILGKHVAIAPYVYISDRNHEYRDISKPIIRQGYFSRGGIQIGDETWIGIHTSVIGAVKIGRHCVIGANSVVTSDIPDYSVAVGAPARVVKKYNLEKKQWESVNEDIN